jgi:hypothetical protein
MNLLVALDAAWEDSPLDTTASGVTHDIFSVLFFSMASKEKCRAHHRTSRRPARPHDPRYPALLSSVANPKNLSVLTPAVLSILEDAESGSILDSVCDYEIENTLSRSFAVHMARDLSSHYRMKLSAPVAVCQRFRVWRDNCRRRNVTALDAASKYPGTQIYHLQQPLNFLLFKWWLGTESNRRHGDFQSPALPTELPSL